MKYIVFIFLSLTIFSCRHTQPEQQDSETNFFFITNWFNELEDYFDEYFLKKRKERAREQEIADANVDENLERVLNLSSAKKKALRTYFRDINDVSPYYFYRAVYDENGTPGFYYLQCNSSWKRRGDERSVHGAYRDYCYLGDIQLTTDIEILKCLDDPEHKDCKVSCRRLFHVNTHANPEDPKSIAISKNECYDNPIDDYLELRRAVEENGLKIPDQMYRILLNIGSRRR